MRFKYTSYAAPTIAVKAPVSVVVVCVDFLEKRTKHSHDCTFHTDTHTQYLCICMYARHWSAMLQHMHTYMNSTFYASAGYICAHTNAFTQSICIILYMCTKHDSIVVWTLRCCRAIATCQRMFPFFSSVSVRCPVEIREFQRTNVLNRNECRIFELFRK